MKFYSKLSFRYDIVRSIVSIPAHPCWKIFYRSTPTQCSKNEIYGIRGKYKFPFTGVRMIVKITNSNVISFHKRGERGTRWGKYSINRAYTRTIAKLGEYRLKVRWSERGRKPHDWYGLSNRTEDETLVCPNPKPNRYFHDWNTSGNGKTWAVPIPPIKPLYSPFGCLPFCYFIVFRISFGQLVYGS